MKRVIVVGGGFAGLSTSVFLSEKKYSVTLLESSPKLGGRAYSSFNKKMDDYFDNGQHIMMGCYEETISFLKKINSLDKITFQKALHVIFVEKNGSMHKLDASKYLYPFNMLNAILNYRVLSIKERFKIIDFVFDLMCCQSCDLKNKTVDDWLKCKGQSSHSIKCFWEILVVGTLNTTIEQASAEIFHEVLREIFLNGSKAAAIVLPNTGLSKMYVDGAFEFINKHNGKIILSERVKQVEYKNNRITKLITDKNSYIDFDFVVFAVPAFAIKKIEFIGTSKKNIADFKIPTLNYSPILNIHLWLKENPFREKFYGLIDSKIHWLFNHCKHITLTTSTADELVSLDNDEILKQIYSELNIYFPIFNSSLITEVKIIKEKRATFIPNVASNELRQKFISPFENLEIAGDWIDTELPSTIESAVLSARLAASKVTSSLK